MITVIKTKSFSMPTRCAACPMMTSDRVSNYTIDSCTLLNDPDWTKNTINNRLKTRDSKCPLVDGRTYKI